MMIPKFGIFEPLSTDEVNDIHWATLRVLEEIGVRVDDMSTLDLLRDAGCDIDAKARVAKIPQHLVEEGLDSAPSSVLIAGRDRSSDIRLEDKRVHFGLGAGTTSVFDLDTGKWRPSRKTDVAAAASLGDALRNIDFVMSMCCSLDVSKRIMPLCDLQRCLRIQRSRSSATTMV